MGRTLSKDEERLARLERVGVIRRTRRVRLDEIARTAPLALKPQGDIVAALLDERRRGR
jgi:hypothetical protein